jgi:hypothetical protein
MHLLQERKDIARFIIKGDQNGQGAPLGLRRVRTQGVIFLIETDKESLIHLAYPQLAGRRLSE